MKFKGGYNVPLKGRPAGAVEALPEPETLYLPMRSRRFTFSQTFVQDGERVLPGHVLAKDPQCYSVPLLAPRAGTVRLEAAPGHIVLEQVEKVAEEPFEPTEELLHVPKDAGSAGMRRYKLLALGAWQFFQDVETEALPDPFGTPQAVIVSTVQMEPFVARGDVQIKRRLASFTRGLEHLQSLLEYQPTFLVMLDIESEFAERVRELLRGYAWLQPVLIPRRYGLDNFAAIAQRLGLPRDPERPVWALGMAGLLALDRALTFSHPCTVRIVAIGGPAVKSPTHLKAIPGYPLRAILHGRLNEGTVRVISGGALTGQVVPESQMGLGAECSGLTVLPEHREREFLSFLRPGWDRRSYSNCFASVFRRRFMEPLTTGLRGERRACIGCGACEEVCPARIMPHLIHKYLYQDELEEAERAGLHLCVKCGLCSYVCPSKIELRQQFVEAQQAAQRELEAAESPS